MKLIWVLMRRLVFVFLHNGKKSFTYVFASTRGWCWLVLVDVGIIGVGVNYVVGVDVDIELLWLLVLMLIFY